jgi:meso-butanediol dehydrogenase/(S,S)-butanediol dehydrogenase/diacetyl reductase
MQDAKKGSIVNVASVVGLKGVAYMSAYGAAKAGLINFTRATAVEAAPHVRVNCYYSRSCDDSRNGKGYSR